MSRLEPREGDGSPVFVRRCTDYRARDTKRERDVAIKVLPLVTCMTLRTTSTGTVGFSAHSGDGLQLSR